MSNVQLYVESQDADVTAHEMPRKIITHAQTRPLSQSRLAAYGSEDEDTLTNLASEGVALRRMAVEGESSVARHTSALRRVRNLFHHLWITIRSGYRELAGILEIPLMLALLAADVIVVIPLGLFWAFFMEQNSLIGILYLAITQSPMIYGVFKRIKHESQYASIPKEGWEGPSLNKLPEAIEDYKKLLSTQKHDEED